MSKRGENIYKRKDGRWEGRYIKGRKNDGKIKYGYVYSYTYKEARINLLSKKIEYQKLIEISGTSQLILSDWVQEWLKIIEQKVKVSTYSGYSYKINHYILPHIGDMPLNEINEDSIESMIYKLRKNGLYPSTIKVVLRILKSCLKQAILEGKIKINPCENFKFETKSQEKAKALTKAEQKRLEFVAEKNFSNYGFSILLALRTGLRIGELTALKWKNIDLDEGFIYVNKTLQRVYKSSQTTELILTTPKSISSIRKIPISLKLKSWFIRFKRERGENVFVFGREEKPCEPRLLTKYFHKLRAEAKLTTICFHQLRHTFATRCLEAKADIMSVSKLLGHSSIKMTLDIYADSLMEQRIEAINLMDNSI